MAHIRTQIRDAVVAMLRGTATAGGRVYDRRGYKISGSTAINVHLDEEDIEYMTLDYPRLQARTIAITAQIYADDPDTLDTISLEIEQALYADLTLGGLAREAQIRQTSIAVSEQSDAPTYRATTLFSFKAFTKENNPESIA